MNGNAPKLGAMTGNIPRLGTRSLLLGIFIIVIQLGVFGCSTTTVVKLPCPPRPVLDAITPVEQAEISPDILSRISGNQIKLKAYSKKLEVRAGCNN